jgi:hypothetical protein
MLKVAFLHTIPSGFRTLFALVFYKHIFPSGMLICKIITEIYLMNY